MSFRWNVSAKREKYVRRLSFKYSGAYAHVWNKPYIFVPRDFYLWLTFKNLFTPFKSTQELKDFAEKAEEQDSVNQGKDWLSGFHSWVKVGDLLTSGEVTD